MLAQGAAKVREIAELKKSHSDKEEELLGQIQVLTNELKKHLGPLADVTFPPDFMKPKPDLSPWKKPSDADKFPKHTPDIFEGFQ